ncbi:hypothetical protein B0T11DRAFT_317124 [Plectosphaerella cucumerina]|uniref:Uncharacterized protein n=1 Tax=Plectosphaerella cucumerina TaxID=40658 RepID=A0A8K0TMN4_9PEZI|nr:hypothetical protein B0T11DRAFT_317124 [Plectosphaerella cucumerina]
MYRNMHPATTTVLNFVLHMNNGIIEASLKPHIGDMDSAGDASPHGQEQPRMWDSAHGVVLIPAMPSLDRRPSGESSSSSASPETASLEDVGHLNSPELAASLKTLHLNVSDAATGHIHLEPEAAAQSARIFARNHAFEESSPRGWILVRKSSIFTPASIRSGIELRIDIRDSFTTSAVWDSHASIRFEVTDMGVTQSDSIAARRAPVLVPQELADQDMGAEPKPWQIGLANYARGSSSSSTRPRQGLAEFPPRFGCS